MGDCRLDPRHGGHQSEQRLLYRSGSCPCARLSLGVDRTGSERPPDRSTKFVRRLYPPQRMQLAFSYTDLAVPTPKIQKSKYQLFLGIGCLYFFFNSFLLPDGLLYTILLSPFFLVWLGTHKVPVLKYSLLFLLC